MVWPKSNCCSAHSCSCCCSSCSILSRLSQAPTNQINLRLTPPAFLLHSCHSVLLPSFHCPLVQKAQVEPTVKGAGDAMELPLWGCHKYLSFPCNTAMLQEPPCWLIGPQEQSAPLSTGQTAQPLSPLPHRHSLLSRGQAVLGERP